MAAAPAIAPPEPAATTPTLYLVLDIGSSSARAAAIAPPTESEAATTLATATAVYAPPGALSDEDGSADAAALARTVDDVMTQVITHARVREVLAPATAAAAAAVHPIHVAIVATSFVGNVMLVDAADGQPATRLHTYAAHGGRVTAALAALRAAAPPAVAADIHNRTGAPLAAAYAPVALRQWLDVGTHYLAGRHMTSLASWVLWRWAGSDGTHPGMSLNEGAWNGLVNVESGCWDSRTLTDLFPPDAAAAAAACLPRVPTVDTQLSHPRVGGALAAALSVAGVADPSAVVVSLHPPVGDGAAATFGSGAALAAVTAPAGLEVAVTVGTSAAVRARLPLGAMRASAASGCTPATTGLWCYRITPHEVLVGGALTDGGSITGSPGDSEDTTTAATTPSGVVCLPFFSGERATGWRDTLRGAYLGVPPHTPPAELTRAAVEGVCFRLRAMADGIAALAGAPGTPPAAVLASGGALLGFATWSSSLGTCCELRVHPQRPHTPHTTHTMPPCCSCNNGSTIADSAARGGWRGSYHRGRVGDGNWNSIWRPGGAARARPRAAARHSGGICRCWRAACRSVCSIHRARCAAAGR